ncbi:MAG: hypothetical protein CMA72_04705 [Euryarchaeota archaeon]|nr:hypothetical protein [Euryarchaeota archaeon]
MMPRKPIPESQLLKQLDELYESDGYEALTFVRLKSEGIYHKLYAYGWNAEKICNRYGMTKAEWKEQCRIRKNLSNGHIHWTPEQVYQCFDEMVAHYDYVPTAHEIRKGPFVHYGGIFGYMSDYGITYDVLRAKYPDRKYGPQFGQMREDIDNPAGGMKNRARYTESVNGMRWHSRCEASLSNFLYSRGITHRKGELYPEEYAETSDYARGWYDIHFEAPDGRQIDVEIWGNIDEAYMKKRQAKEDFNSDNPNFLGMDWDSCIEERLIETLEPYIGIIEPFVFEKPEHKIIQTAFWSDAEEIIETCRSIAAQQPDGRFPTEHWLRKRGHYADREGETYNTLGIYIQKYVGGLLKLREILGEDTSHYIRWDAEKTLEHLDLYLQKTGGLGPKTIYSRLRRKGLQQTPDAKEAATLGAALDKYHGGQTAAIIKLGYAKKNRLALWIRTIK